MLRVAVPAATFSLPTNKRSSDLVIYASPQAIEQGALSVVVQAVGMTLAEVIVEENLLELSCEIATKDQRHS
jgi:hypothetical protein